MNSKQRRKITRLVAQETLEVFRSAAKDEQEKCLADALAEIANLNRRINDLESQLQQVQRRQQLF